MAFTVCSTGNFTYLDNSIPAEWLDTYFMRNVKVPTEIGLCKTFNFCKRHNFVQERVDEGRVFVNDTDNESEKFVNDPEDFFNETQPYKTSSRELGFDVTIYHADDEDEPDTLDHRSYILMIHSPFELPTKENHKFYLNDRDKFMFYVTPQLETVDDTMIDMDPHE